MTVRHLIVPGIVASLLIVACGDEPKPAAPTPPPTVVNKPVAEAQATPDAGTTADAVAYVYSYAPVGKRDPFRSPIATGPGPGPTQQCENAGPLGQWGLDQLTLVGT